MAIRPNLWSPGMVEPDGRLSRTLIDYLNTLGDTTSAGLAASIAAVDARVTALAAAPFNINGTPHSITILGDSTTGLAVSIAYDYPGQTSITTLGTITVGTWNGTVIGPTYGGTGLSSYTAGDLIYATATNVLGKLAAGTNGYALRMVAGAPVWAETVAETVTNGVTGIAPSQDAVFDAIAALSSVYQPLDAQLTDLAGLTYGSNALKVVRVNAGETGWELATVSGGSLSDGDYGDVTVGGSGTTMTIDNDSVTYAKMQNVSATSRILGRKTSGAGDTEECTLSEVLDFIGSAAQGDILYRGASAWARLAAGTSGHFLKTQGAAADPVWAAASGGSGAMTLLATGTVTGSAATTIAISGLDLSTAKHFVLEISLKNATASNANISCYYNADTTASNYHEQLLTGYITSVSGARTNDAIMMSLTGSGFSDAVGNIWASQDTKPVASFIVAPREGAAISNIFIRHWAHMWNSATNVTAITISSSVANSLAVGSYVKVFGMA